MGISVCLFLFAVVTQERVKLVCEVEDQAEKEDYDDGEDSQGILRVKPAFLVHGTSTGRLSSTGPNVQNMPRDKAIRKIVGVS